MTEPSQKADKKRTLVFGAAAKVFSQYGFRRTSMNDIAQVAGISRPALYLLFDNKEDLFRKLACHRQNKAIEEAITVLNLDNPFVDRFTNAILAYERIFYEPVAESPHGTEFLNASASIASDDMSKGHERLVKYLSDAVKTAIEEGEISLTHTGLRPKAFVELLMTSVSGQKKVAASAKTFRRNVRDVTSIFLNSISATETN